MNVSPPPPVEFPTLLYSGPRGLLPAGPHFMAATGFPPFTAYAAAYYGARNAEKTEFLHIRLLPVSISELAADRLHPWRPGTLFLTAQMRLSPVGSNIASFEVCGFMLGFRDRTIPVEPAEMLHLVSLYRHPHIPPRLWVQGAVEVLELLAGCKCGQNHLKSIDEYKSLVLGMR